MQSNSTALVDRGQPSAPSARAWLLALLLGLGLAPQWSAAQDQQPNQQPIAYIGHGVFFDAQGQPLTMTPATVAGIQAWYRQYLLKSLSPTRQREFTALESRTLQAAGADGQARLVVQQQALSWLFANLPAQRQEPLLLGKMRALEFALKHRLPGKPEDAAQGLGEPFVMEQRVQDAMRALNAPSFGAIKPLSATMNQGQAYINECAAARVPIPPPINQMDPAGTAGWKSQGFIPGASQFIVGSPAEVRTFSTPDGLCIALPRYNAAQTTVNLDGVICTSRITSKVCFWDNQMAGSSFTFPAGTRIPIGLPNPAIDPMGRYQAGGFELSAGAGGMCTDCHAGENPYIIHPRVNLGSVLFGNLQDPPQNLPTFPPNRYDPLVRADWAQNALSQAGPTLPGVCAGCHVKGDAGRFPHLSNQLPGYCNTVLAQAITKTMPPGSPGSAAVEANAFKNAWCNGPPNAASADAGDPHLTTTNGINYDFQAAGEFTVLRNSDTGFELQTRQSPVLSSFTPVANAYTGLSSCVSLNTAVAVRVGKHRITLQPAQAGFANTRRLVLRVDGEPVNASGGLDLGGGNRIDKPALDGEVDIRLADGTRVVVTPLFWTSQSLWYLDLQVFNTPAREGVMGPILAPDWLPRAPDGSSFGGKPVAVGDRHILLNRKFADAWRVKPTTSLFDYAPGTSTADFTDADWPAEPGKGCASTSIAGRSPTVREPRPDLAKKVCRGIKDPAILANCVFDVTVMGDAVAAKGHQRADKLKATMLTAAGNP